MPQEFSIYAGIDWGDESHQVCLLDGKDRSPRQRSFEHSGRGLSALVTWLLELAHTRPERVAVALEVPRGPVVDALLQRGITVFALNPKQLDRFRDRYTVAGAKDDRRDALVLADSLRTDEAAYRRIRAEDPSVIRLREWTRLQEDLKGERRRLANRLRSQLKRYYPQLLQLSPAADDPWMWAVLEAAPTPQQGRRVRHMTVSRILTERRIRRVKPKDVLAVLAEPPLPCAPGVVDAAATHVSVLIPRLKLVERQIRELEANLETELRQLAEEDGRSEHRDVQVLRSLPGAGTNVVATMLAEATEPLVARDYHRLRTQSGIAPVTKQSGKTLRVQMRHACNRRLREATFHWARCAAQRDPWARALYQEHRRRGQSYGRALRAVADRLLRLATVLLRSGSLYDPERRRLILTPG